MTWTYVTAQGEEVQCSEIGPYRPRTRQERRAFLDLTFVLRYGMDLTRAASVHRTYKANFFPYGQLAVKP